MPTARVSLITLLMMTLEFGAEKGNCSCPSARFFIAITILFPEFKRLALGQSPVAQKKNCRQTSWQCSSGLQTCQYHNRRLLTFLSMSCTLEPFPLFFKFTNIRSVLLGWDGRANFNFILPSRESMSVFHRPLTLSFLTSISPQSTPQVRFMFREMMGRSRKESSTVYILLVQPFY